MNPIKEAQQAIVKDLEADQFFAGIPVIDQDKGDVSADVLDAIARLGLCVIVELKDADVGVEGMGFQTWDVIITVEETVLINRAEGGTGKEATDVVVAIINRFTPFLRNSATPSPMRLRKARVINDQGGKLVYQLTGTKDIQMERKV